jgi:Kdo2-lipid IVA lauroyltransferase/acyltransferase
MPNRGLALMLRLAGMLPLPLLHALGVGLGWLFWLLPNPHRAITLTNLRLALPVLSDKARRQLARRSLIETGKAICETPLLLTASARRLARLFEVRGDCQLIDLARSRGRGVILIIPHLGNWEVINLACSPRYPLTALYRPPRQAWLDQWLKQGRQRFGAQLVATDSRGIRALRQALQENRVVPILPDQDPREKGGIFAPFFNIDANTMTLLPRLAARSGATLLYAWAERKGWGRGFRLHLQPADGTIATLPLAEGCAVLNAGLEQLIRRRPEQYQWSYRRYRTRPDGENGLY